ncbi:MAG: serine/threonine-protein kinase, partial [Ktedonobacteraceae bacterium]
MEDRAGQQLGNYRLLRQLGTGGFAEVYLGEHVHLGTQAAIKVLHTRLSREDHEYFRNEARIVAHLIHPHIVRVLDFGIEDAVPFLVMDYAPGGTLRELHPRKSRVPLAGVRTYVAQIASALHYAHQHKIVHRDIKPENMLLNAEQEVVLSDFGIALISRSSRNQSLQDVVGTLAYMAPEQLRGKPCPASDQYALGIVIYEWLCGECPFHGTFIELCSQHMLVDPPSFAEKHLEMPSLIEQVVRTALAKDPVERFNSIEAFARAFEQASLHAAPQAFVPTINLNKPVPMQSTSDTERAVTSIQVAPSSIQRRIPTQPVTLPPFTSQSSPASLVRPLSATTRSPQYGLSRRTVLYGGLVGVGLAGLAGSALAAW